MELVRRDIYRFADSLVNVDVVDESGAITVIDSAVPFFSALAGIDRTVADIAAM